MDSLWASRIPSEFDGIDFERLNDHLAPVVLVPHTASEQLSSWELIAAIWHIMVNGTR
jgi:hypothetical protein